MPELKQALVEHDQNSAHIAWTVFVEIDRGGRRVGILPCRAVSLTVENSHRNERIEEVADGARMQAQFGAQLGASKSATGELCKYVKFNCREENLRRPESEGSLKNRTGIKLQAGAVHKAISQDELAAGPTASARDVTRCQCAKPP